MIPQTRDGHIRVKDDAATPVSRPWLSRIVGLAVLAAVIVAAIYFSDERAFLRLASEAEPAWLVAALVLQSATYLAQGEIWRAIGRQAGSPLPLTLVYKLALAKLFVDQALPSGGVSGTLIIAQALERRALPRPAILAGVVINTTSFFIGYAAAIVVAWTILFASGRAGSFALTACVLFILLSAGLVFGLLELTARDIRRGPAWFLRNRFVSNALSITKDAAPELVRSVRLQMVASGFQLATFLLDALTLWVLIRSLGAWADPSHVFASFMLANVVRTVSFIPGGLGTFEAAIVLMLRTGGVSVAVGLSAALLFRGVTFFLPMVPGMWFSRRLTRLPAGA